jgi:hypothetical protein
LNTQAKPIRDPYIYNALFPSLAPGAQETFTINIKADADFIWMKGVYQADIAGAALTNASRVIPLCTVLLVDAGSGRQLMDQAMPVPNLFGIGELPFILNQPKTFARSSSLLVTVTNYSNATTYTNLYLSFAGLLLFYL